MNNDKIKEMQHLKNTIRVLEDLQYYINKQLHNGEINQEVHDSIGYILKDSIQNKMWCLLEHIDKLES